MLFRDNAFRRFATLLAWRTSLFLAIERLKAECLAGFGHAYQVRFLLSYASNPTAAATSRQAASLRSKLQRALAGLVEGSL